MGRAVLVFRLAGRNLRRRPAEAVLLLLAITAATATLTLGLVLRGVNNHPYESTREATAGPDVVASVGAEFVDQSADLAGLEALTDAPGVADHSGPYPLVGAELEVDGLGDSRRTPRGEEIGGAAGVWAMGRDAETASVDQPQVTQGSWVRDGGVVVEAGFADALDVGPGDDITLKTRLCTTTGQMTGPDECRVATERSFRVVGVAVTAAARPYPDVCYAPLCPWFAEAIEETLVEAPPDEVLSDESFSGTYSMEPIEPGLVWLTDADARGLVPAEQPLSYVVNLKLDDPADVPAFGDDYFSASTDAGYSFSTSPPVIMESWHDIRLGHANVVEDQQVVLRIGSRLIALLGVASIAVLVGGRMADQTRRVGLLKAGGGTPTLVAVVLLTEFVMLALLGAAAGLAAGWLAAPLLTDPGAALVGRAGTPSLTVSTVVLVTAVALGVAVAATVVPTLRAAFTSTVHALADAARPPRRTPWLIAMSARLPVPLLLGLRIAARRPRRVVLSAVSIAIAVSGIVAALAAQATNKQDGQLVGGTDPSTARINQVLLVISVTLGVLAAVNAIFVTWATALDAKHSSSLARALGATPQQVSTGLSAAQVLPALVGAVLGIAGGLALFAALSGDEAANPPLWQLLAVAPVTVLVVAALTTIPARLGARRPTAEVLSAELV
jgi:predicted lysophospholipase L1 biosynthesis ABC-type transport system permease subunit